MPKLTAAFVERIAPHETRQEIADSLMTSLYLIVQPSGRKSWQCRYRASGKHRRMTLGHYPLVSLGEARERAKAALREVADGGDPAEERKRRSEEAKRDTVKALFELYCARHLNGLKSGSTVRREMERHAIAKWEGRDIRSVSRRDVREVLDAITDSGRLTTANRLRAYLGKFFNWCVERDVLEQSPMLGIRAPAKEVSRDRVLSDDELRWLWVASGRVVYPWGPLARFLLLTGARLGEAVGMRHEEIRGDLWSLPATRVKNSRPHDVPLSAPVLQIVGELPRMGRDGLLFSTTGERPVSGFTRGRNRLSTEVEKVAREELVETVEIARWGFHDLRRTAATRMASLGVSPIVVEACLNHVSGARAGVAGVYNRHHYAEEKRQALEAWGRFLIDLAEGSGTNVVQISEVAR